MITVFISPNRLVKEVVALIHRMKKKGFTLSDTCWDLEAGFQITFRRAH